MNPACFVVHAHLELHPGTDPAAVGAQVTSALCGHWEHPGPCRWPHNNAIDTAVSPALFRTLYVSDPLETEAVAALVHAALTTGSGWTVTATEQRDPEPSEAPLTARLLACPRASRG